MVRRTFLKKAALAAVGTAAFASPLSATLNNSETRMKVLLINGRRWAGGYFSSFAIFVH